MLTNEELDRIEAVVKRLKKLESRLLISRSKTKPQHKTNQMPLSTKQKTKLEEIKTATASHYLALEEIVNDLQGEIDDSEDDTTKEQEQVDRMQECIDDLNGIEDKLGEVLK